MKKYLPFLCLITLASCSGNSSEPIESESSTDSFSSLIEDVSSESSKSLEVPSSSELASSGDSSSIEVPSSSESTSPEENESSSLPLSLSGSISSIKEGAAALLKGSVANDKGYVFTEVSVSLSARVYFYGGMITTKSGCGNPYSAFAVDETGYLYCDIDSSTYSGNPSKYAGTENQYFEIKGTLSSFKGTPHVQVTSFEFIKNPSFEVGNETIKNLASSIQNMGDVYSYIENLPINLKGCGYGNIASFTGRYIAKMDDSVLLFSDGSRTMKVHGNNKISNSFTLNNVYTVYGVMDEYIFAPGMEYLFAESSDASIPNQEANRATTCANTYSWKYTNDIDSHQSAYEGVFGNVYSVTGYVNAYLKDGAYYFVLTDSYYENDFAAYTNALIAKALFFKNETENNLKTEVSLNYSLLYPYYVSGELITLSFAPYLWNTQKYFQGYILPGSVSVIETV